MTFGIIASLGTGLLFAAGNLVQKRAVDRLSTFSLRAPVATLASVATSGIWMTGAVLSVGGILFQLAAYRKISIAAVQAICAAGIIVLLVIARAIFGERLSRREQVGLVCALVALALIIASMSGSSAGSSSRFLTARTEIAIGFTVLVTAFALAYSMRRTHSSGGLFAVGSGLLYGATGLGVKAASAAFTSSGFLRGVERLFSGPIPYSVGCTWIAALLLFQVGLQRSRVSIVAPISTVVSTVYVVALGTPLFDEAWPASPLRFALRVIGLLVTLVALAVALAPENPKLTEAPTSPVPTSETDPVSQLPDATPDDVAVERSLP